MYPIENLVTTKLFFFFLILFFILLLFMDSYNEVNDVLQIIRVTSKDDLIRVYGQVKGNNLEK